MRYGMCVQNQQIEFVDEIAKMGYDYIECRFNLFAEQDNEKIEELRRSLERNNIKCESCNCFIPGSMHITGDSVDEKALSEYIETGMKGASALGCKIVVFGSGGARSIPEGYDREKGTAQIIHFLKDIVSPIAEKYGMTVVIEPLKRPDSNILNTVREAVALTEKVNSPYISALADLYHMYGENETEESLLAFSGKIKHCHIANAADRSYPKESDGFDYSKFILVMQSVGCERCSVEGSTKDYLKDSKESVELLKKL